jgi:exopolysaccharide biosynthesis polyprenyl glycosylphosphotransferase
MGVLRKIIVFVIDCLIVFGAIILSFILLKNGTLLNYSNNIGAFYYLSPVIVLAFLANSYVFGMFNLQRQSVSETIYTVFITSVGLTICIMAAAFFVRESATSYPRSVIVLSFFLYCIFLTLWRTSLQIFHLKIYGKRTVLIIGPSNNPFIGTIKANKFYEIKHICGQADHDILTKARTVTDIFITTEVSSEQREKIFLLSAELQNLRIYFQPQMNDIAIMNAKLFTFDDIPMHIFKNLYLTDEERIVKRIIDITVSGLSLIILSPVFLILPLLIKLDGGPVFYRQVRLTRDGRKFKIIKFRTMIPFAEAVSGPTLSKNNDNRITRLGRILRMTRLDEIPQLFNVLIGEMSLVGPRPERPYFAKKLEDELPEFKFRLNVKAGLTGLAQVKGKYNTDFSVKIQYDLLYIYQFSLFRDVVIMLQTLKILLLKSKVEGVSEPASTDVPDHKKNASL